MPIPLAEALRRARELLSTACLCGGNQQTHVADRVLWELDRALESLEGGVPRDEVVSRAFHDLQEPLGTVVMGAVLLAKAIPNEDAAHQRVVAAMLRSAERVGQAATDLHDLLSLRPATHRGPTGR